MFKIDSFLIRWSINGNPYHKVHTNLKIALKEFDLLKKDYLKKDYLQLFKISIYEDSREKRYAPGIENNNYQSTLDRSSNRIVGTQQVLRFE